MSEQSWSRGGGRGAPAGRSSERPGASGTGPAGILDKRLDTVEQGVRVASCGCQSVWCERCRARNAGLRKRYLGEVTRDFADPRMLSFTVDPKRGFSGPGEAYDFAQKNRLVAECMRRFGKGRWVCVLEVQKNGWPHWHVIIDGYVNVVDVRAWWTERCGLVPAERQTQVQIERVEHRRVANYLCGYLSKGGKAPQWIRDRRNVRGISVSRSVLSWSKWLKRGRAADQEEEDQEGRERKGGKWRLIGVRLDGCGSAFVVLAEREVITADGEVLVRRKYLKRVKYPLRTILAAARGLGLEFREVYDWRVIAWARAEGSGGWVPQTKSIYGLRALVFTGTEFKRLAEVVDRLAA